MTTNNYCKIFNISPTHFVGLLLFIFFSISPALLFAQQKTKKKIFIEESDSMLSGKTIVANAQRLFGSQLKISHDQMVIFCDSAWVYTNTNSVNAFGKVHIINNDTLHMWADKIHYDGDSRIAKARFHVKLEDPKLTLTTDSLDFNTFEKIGYYNWGGTIVDSTNTLTSIIGRYYTTKNEVFFTDSVVLVNKDYTMNTDTMTYNTKTSVASFFGPSTIVGTDTYFYTEKGWFNTKTNVSEMVKRSTMRKEDTQLQGDYIFYNDSTGVGIAEKNVIINDFKNKMIITRHKAWYNDFTKYASMTDSAVWIQYTETDSLFLHADTLMTRPDTTATDAKMLFAYNNARFFRSDIQGLCDSLTYFTKDSLIQLHRNPILWSQENQMTANFIKLVSKPVPPDEIHLNNNAFIIQEVDSMKFNQIKGKNMLGLINNNELYRIDVNGNGQSIYYPADDKTYIGMNKAESSNIIIYMGEKKIKRLTFVGTPKGNLKPLEKVAEESKLEGFSWHSNKRPMSKFDIFDDNNKANKPQKLPNSTIDKILPGTKQLLPSTKKQEEQGSKLIE